MADVIHFTYQVDDRQLDQAARKVEGLGKASQQSAQVGQSSLGGLLDMAGKVGFALFGLQQTVGMVAGAVQGMFSGNLQFEQFQTKFEVMLGSADAAKERIKELEEFGRTTPFELPGVVQASTVLETLTQGALSTGEGLRLVGDVASGIGQPIDEMAVLFGRMYSGLQSGRPVGETMQRMQELGIVSGETRNVLEGMQEAGVDGAVVWDTFAGTLDQWSGMMDKQSKTVGGALSNISDGIGALKRNLMQGIFDAAKPGVMAFAALLGSEGVQGAAEKLGQTLGTGLGKAAELLGTAFSIAAPIIKDVVMALFDLYALEWGILVEAFQQIRDIAVPLFEDLAELVNNEVVPAFQDLIEQVQSMDFKAEGMEVLDDSMGSLSEKFSSVGDALETVMPLWESLSGDILKSVSEEASKIAAVFGEELGPTLDSLQSMLETVAPILGVVLVAAITAALVVLERLVPIIGTVLIGAIQLLGIHIRTIAGIFEAAFKAIEGVFKIFKGLFTADWDLMWEGIKQTVSAVKDASVVLVQGFVDTVLTVAKTAWNMLNTATYGKLQELMGYFADLPGQILGVLADLPSLLLQLGKDLIQGLWDGALFVWKEMKEWLGKAGALIKEGLGNLGNLLVDVGRAIVDGLWSGIQGAWQGLIGKIQGALDMLPGPIKKFLGISSPSKLFADEIGRPMAEGVAMGFVEGMVNATPETVSAVKTYFNQILDEMLKNIDEGSGHIGDHMNDALSALPAELRPAAIAAGRSLSDNLALGYIESNGGRMFPGGQHPDLLGGFIPSFIPANDQNVSMTPYKSAFEQELAARQATAASFGVSLEEYEAYITGVNATHFPDADTRLGIPSAAMGKYVVDARTGEMREVAHGTYDAKAGLWYWGGKWQSNPPPGGSIVHQYAEGQRPGGGGAFRDFTGELIQQQQDSIAAQAYHDQMRMSAAQSGGMLIYDPNTGMPSVLPQAGYSGGSNSYVSPQIRDMFGSGGGSGGVSIGTIVINLATGEQTYAQGEAAASGLVSTLRRSGFML